MVEVVRRPLHHDQVARRVDAVRDAPGDLREVVDVHPLVDHDDVLRQHEEPEPPEPVHHLADLPRVALLHRHDDEVVEDALGRHVHVDDLRQHHPDDRQEQALRRLAEPVVLHGRPPHDDRRVDRVAAARHRGQVEDGVGVGERVVARVVAERPLDARLRGVAVALEDDLRVGRHLEVDRPALHHLDALPADPAGEQDLVEARRERARCPRTWSPGRRRGRSPPGCAPARCGAPRARARPRPCGSASGGRGCARRRPGSGRSRRSGGPSPGRA